MEGGEKDYDGQDRRASNPWKLKREVSVGDLLLAATIAGGVALWGQGVEKRLAVVETMQSVQHRIDAGQDGLIRDAVARIETAIRDLRTDFNRKP